MGGSKMLSCIVALLGRCFPAFRGASLIDAMFDGNVKRPGEFTRAETSLVELSIALGSKPAGS